jgi:hypothetical protein
MIGQDDELRTLVDEYLSGTLMLQQVEQWASGHDAAEFGDWEADLFRRLELDLAEMGSAGLTEAELQSDVREFLATRPLVPEYVFTSRETSLASSANSVYRIGGATLSRARAA